MSAELTRAVTDEEIATYERDGVVVLRAIYPIEWVDKLRAAMDDVFARTQPGEPVKALVSGTSSVGSRSDMVDRVTRFLADDGDRAELALEDDEAPEGRSIVETDACSWHEGLWDHHSDGPLPQIVATLTDSTKVVLYSDQLFLKEAGSRVRTPWHQDKPYWVKDGAKVAVCWVPVDVVTIESGAMGYVAGSHQWGTIFKPSDFLTSTGTYPKIGGIEYDDLADLPPIDAQPENYDIRRHEAGPGDVIVHNWMTLHGSTGNVSAGSLRRAASVRYAGDDVTFLRRRSSPEPFRNTIDLEDGELLENAERFRVVWPQCEERFG